MGRAVHALGAGTDLVLRALIIQGIWIAGTLAGGIVLGWAPATLAAVDAAAHARRGEPITLRGAARVWREQWLRAQLVLGLPALLLLPSLTALLATGVPLAVRVLAGIGALLVLAVLMHVPAVELRYRLRARDVLGRASALALAQAPMALVLAAALALWGGILAAVPGLVPFLGAAVPLLAAEHLVGRSIDRNEELLAVAGDPPRPADATPRPEAAPRPVPAPRPRQAGHPTAARRTTPA